MKLDLTPSLPPEVSVVGNASQSTLELLNELVKQGAVVIQNATLMQNVTVNHSNISVASANCSQTITTHCMGNNAEEVERTVCAGGHDVSSTNQTRCEPHPSEWSSFEVPAAPENTNSDYSQHGGRGVVAPLLMECLSKTETKNCYIRTRTGKP